MLGRWFPGIDYWELTFDQTVNFAKGALMHYKMEMSMHAMSEDSDKAIKKQLMQLWDYMFPPTREYGEKAIDKLNRVKKRYGID